MQETQEESLCSGETFGPFDPTKRFLEKLKADLSVSRPEKQNLNPTVSQLVSEVETLREEVQFLKKALYAEMRRDWDVLCELQQERTAVRYEIYNLKAAMQQGVVKKRGKKEQPTQEMLDHAERVINSNFNKVFMHYDFEPVVSAWWARKVCRELSKQGRIRKVGPGKYQSLAGPLQVKNNLSFAARGIPAQILEAMKRKPGDFFQPKEFVHLATLNHLYDVFKRLEKSGYVRRSNRGFQIVL